MNNNFSAFEKYYEILESQEIAIEEYNGVAKMYFPNYEVTVIFEAKHEFGHSAFLSLPKETTIEYTFYDIGSYSTPYFLHKPTKFTGKDLFFLFSLEKIPNSGKVLIKGDLLKKINQ